MARKPRGKPPSRFNLKLLGVVVAVVAITTPLAVLGRRAVFNTKGESRYCHSRRRILPAEPAVEPRDARLDLSGQQGRPPLLHDLPRQRDRYRVRRQ